MNLKKQISSELERIQREAKDLTASIGKDPLFLAGVERLQEAWATRGKPGLDALLALQTEYGPFLEKLAKLNWARLESGVESQSSLLALREAEELSAKVRDEIPALIRQSESVPAKIERLDPGRELPHLHGCKGSDFLMAEITGPEAAEEFRSRI